MLRFLNIVAMLSLMGSAVYAYTIKYETAYRAEQIAKTKIEIKQERDAIAVLRAEWAFMTRPERLQQLADAHLRDMKQLDATQIVSARQAPDKAPHVDTIGQKLDALIGGPDASAKKPETTSSIPKAPAPKLPAAPKPTPVKATTSPAAPAKTASAPKASTTAAKAPATVQPSGQSSGQKKL